MPDGARREPAPAPSSGSAGIAGGAPPLASGADALARLAEAPLSGAGRPLEVQLRARLPSSGERFLHEQLGRIRARTEQGERVVVVFDLDNTLFDTRARTLAVARAFDEVHGTDHFASLALGDVRVSGRETALAREAPALPAAVIEAFDAFWQERFWRPDHLAHDAPMHDVLRWVRSAQQAGAEVRYLTGRVQAFHAASVAQLRRAGIAVDEADVVCKPDVQVRTAPFKSEVLRAWSTEAALGWFLTEGRRDLSHVQAEAPAVPTVCLECSFEEGALAAAHPIDPATPRLPALF